MFSNITPAWNRLLAVGAVVTLAAGMSGCATHYAMKVDAIQNPNVKGGQSYRIVGKEALLPSRQKSYADALRFVRTALEGRGLYEAPDPKTADMIIEVEFDVGARRAKLRPVDEPDTFVSPSQQMPMGNAIPVSRNPLAGGPAAHAQQQQQQQAQMGQQRPESFVIFYVYEKRLSISARETPENASSDHSPAEIWRVDVTLEDENTTIDPLLPVMAAAAADKVGTDTRSRQNVKISEKDAIVAYVRNGR